METVSKRQLIDLPIDKIIPTRDNPRKIDKKDPGMKELAESITATGGVIQAVIVRVHPTKPGFYDLRAGERRLVAAQMAGFIVIKADVMEMDDRLAREITAVENLQRKDLTPMEEAQGIELLLKSTANPDDVKHVAATLGRTEGWVYRRARLMSLTKNWRKALQGEDFQHWGAGHLELIARYSPDIQDLLLAEFSEYSYPEEMSVARLQAELGRKFLLVDKAPWKKDDETLLPKAGACNVCQKRSSCTPHLFDDLDKGKTGAGDRCLDYNCWAAKFVAYVGHREEKLRAEHPNLILLCGDGSRDMGEAREAIATKYPKAEDAYKFKDVKKTEKGAMPAMVISGGGAGTLRWVQLNKLYATSTIKRTQQKGPDGHLTMAARRERLQGRRAAHAIEALKGTLNKFEPVNSVLHDDRTADGSGEGRVRTLMRFTTLLTIFGTAEKKEFRDKKVWMDVESWPIKTDDCLIDWTEKEWSGLINRAWAQLQPIFARRLFVNDCADALSAIPEAKKISALLGINFDELMNQAIEAIPEPKSWAAEKPTKKAKAGKKETTKPKAKKPVKGVCRVCGCTETTPCAEGCAWANKAETLCTACKEKAKKKK